MIKTIVNRVLSRFGFQLVSSSLLIDNTTGFRLYNYVGADGKLDYRKYRQVQNDGNSGKLGYVWVLEENIAFLSHYIKNTIPEPRFGLCHGTRRGMEQQWFKEYLHCDVIGTEIAESAVQFPFTIKWDFHEVKNEWINSTDFVYSNSLDHSYDPEKCLNAWMSCLKKGGLCFLEHSSQHAASKACELDPFGADIVIMPYLITIWGKGRYGVREILDSPAKPNVVEHLKYLVIERF